MVLTGPSHSHREKKKNMFECLVPKIVSEGQKLDDVGESSELFMSLSSVKHDAHNLYFQSLKLEFAHSSVVLF